MFLCFLAAPCQNVLDYFKTVLEFHNQLVQPMPEEQLTEVRRATFLTVFFQGMSCGSICSGVERSRLYILCIKSLVNVIMKQLSGVKMWCQRYLCLHRKKSGRLFLRLVFSSK